eukprot:gene35305-42778_t
MLKRKHHEGEEDASGLVQLEGQVKKCKISCTPGELRLSKDVASIERSPQPKDFVVEPCDRPNSVTIKFIHPTYSETSSSGAVEWKFLVEVPKYYPHDPPKVKFVGMPHTVSNGARFINIADEVQHPLLFGCWNATSCLKTVIDLLRHFIRESINSQNHDSSSDQAAGMMIA